MKQEGLSNERRVGSACYITSTQRARNHARVHLACVCVVLYVILCGGTPELMNWTVHNYMGPPILFSPCRPGLTKIKYRVLLTDVQCRLDDNDT